jgi:hypothetical protein
VGIITEEKITIKKYCCDNCGKNSENDIIDWKEVGLVIGQNVFLLEKPRKYSYESFHVPNKKVCVFCSNDCLKRFIDKNLDLFVLNI